MRKNKFHFPPLFRRTAVAVSLSLSLIGIPVTANAEGVTTTFVQDKQIINLEESTVSPAPHPAYPVRDLYAAIDMEALTSSWALSIKNVYSAYGNPLRLEIRRDEAGAVRKITAIESRGQLVTILDLYYDTAGSGMFAFERSSTIYTPVSLNSRIPGTKYYVKNNSLVAEQKIDPAGNITEIVLDGVTSYESNTVYSAMSDGDKALYDAAEVRIVNILHNAYQAAASMVQTSGTLHGAVRLLDGSPAAGVSVEFRSQTGQTLGTTMTGADGSYRGVVSLQDSVQIIIRQNGYQEVLFGGLRIDDSATEKTVETAVLVPATAENKNIVVHLADSLINGSATGANSLITIYDGVRTDDGAVLASSTVDANGDAYFSVPAGMHALTVTCPGYNDTQRTIVVSESDTYVVHLVRPVEGNDIRVLLSWQGDVDLDLHCYAQSGSDIFQVDRNNPYDMEGHYFVIDSRDDIGCEVLSVPNPDDGVFRFYVTDYQAANVPLSSNLSKVSAQVDVYTTAGRIAHYDLPYSASGVAWEVFAYANGGLTELSTVYSSAPATTGWGREKAVENTAEVVHDTYSDIIAELQTMIDGSYRYPNSSYNAASLQASSASTAAKSFFSAVLERNCSDLQAAVYGFADVNADGYDELLFSLDGDITRPDFIYERINGSLIELKRYAKGSSIVNGNSLRIEDTSVPGINRTAFVRPGAGEMEEVLASVYTDTNAEQGGGSLYWYGDPSFDCFPIDIYVYYGYVITLTNDQTVGSYKLMKDPVPVPTTAPAPTAPAPTPTAPPETTAPTETTPAETTSGWPSGGSVPHIILPEETTEAAEPATSGFPGGGSVPHIILPEESTEAAEPVTSGFPGGGSVPHIILPEESTEPATSGFPGGGSVPHIILPESSSEAAE